MWVVYDTQGRPTWYVLPSGSWGRDANNALHFSGAVYRTSGPYWGGAYDPAAVALSVVGTGDFLPLGVSRALFGYTIEGVTGSRMIERFQF